MVYKNSNNSSNDSNFFSISKVTAKVKRKPGNLQADMKKFEKIESVLVHKILQNNKANSTI